MRTQRISCCLIVFFIKILMASGVVCADAGRNELITAAFDGSLKKVNLLLAQGAHPNAVDKFGESALMKAAFLGHLEIAKSLIRFIARYQALLGRVCLRSSASSTSPSRAWRTGMTK